MLLLGRDVTLRTIGQLNVEVCLERRCLTQLQSRDRIHFVRKGRDAAIANPYRLQFHARLLPFVQDEGFSRIHLFFVLRQIVLDLRSNRPGPSESFFIGHAIFQLHRLLDRGKRCLLDLLDR